MLQILDETIEFYSNDPDQRSVGKYNSPDLKHCAVGRCLLTDLKEKGTSLVGNDLDLLNLVCKNELENLDQVLLPEYRGHSMLFWEDLQNLHDSDLYWTDSGLSSVGHNKAEKMRNRIDESYYYTDEDVQAT